MTTGNAAQATPAAAPRERRWPLWLGASAVAIAAVAAAALALRPGSHAGGANDASVRPVVAAVIDLRPYLNGIAVGGGSVWVTSSDGAAVAAEGSQSSLWRIDPRTNEPAAPRAAGIFAHGVTVGFGSVWTTGTDGTRRIDLRTGTLRAVVRGVHGDAIVAGAGWVWEGRDRIDPHTNRVLPGSGVEGIVAAAGPLGVWTTGESVRRIDARSGREIASIVRRGFSPDAVAEGGGSVWVAYSSTTEWEVTSLARVDPHTNRIVRRPIELHGHLPAAVAVAAGYVWLLTHNEEEQGARLWQIDPRKGAIVGSSLRLRRGTPFLLAAGRHTLWVAEDLDEGTVTRVDLRAR